MPVEKTNALRPKACTVVISVLNWNAAAATLACVESLLKLDNPAGDKIEIIVSDNGSASEDWTLLRSKLDDAYPVTLVRHQANLGFAGAHNVAMQSAIDSGADFVWLVNNDAVVERDALTRLIDVIAADAQCGAVSPLILALDDPDTIDFCGARHDWRNVRSIACSSVQEARAMESAHPMDMWLMGAAIMLRVAALREIGLLDEGLFAYYEDNDICARLAAAGWRNRMAFDAVVHHCHPKSRLDDKPPYYFYLMARNSFRFWFRHTPPPYRRRLRLKLVDHAVLTANRLHHRGLTPKVHACLLGVLDGQTGRTGPWDLSRRVPVVMRLLRSALWINHSKHL